MCNRFTTMVERNTEPVRIPKDTVEKIREIVKSKKTDFSTIQHFIDRACIEKLERVV